MDYQQMNQPSQPNTPEIKPEMSPKNPLVISFVVIAVIAGLIAWYFIRTAPVLEQVQVLPGEAVSDTSTAILSGGDTTNDIANDLNSVPSDSAVSDDINDLDKSIQSF